MKSKYITVLIISVASLLVLIISLLFLYLDDFLLPNKGTDYAYNNWTTALISVILFSIIGASFFIPMKKREWRTLGLYEAFIVALFTEMYGFPLTLYFLTSIFGLDLSFGHVQGHLLAVLLAEMKLLDIEVAWAIVMFLSSVLIAIAILLIYQGWKAIHESKGELADSGIYSKSRHPQYLGFILLITGFLIQWPTLISIIIGPILIINYYYLAKKEEKEAIEIFGERYLKYKAKTPMFIWLPMKFK